MSDYDTGYQRGRERALEAFSRDGTLGRWEMPAGPDEYDLGYYRGWNELFAQLCRDGITIPRTSPQEDLR